MICAYSYHPLHHWKSSQNWKVLTFVVRGVNFSLSDQSPVAWLWYPSHEKGDFGFQIGWSLSGWYEYFPHGFPFVQG